MRTGGVRKANWGFKLDTRDGSKVHEWGVKQDSPVSFPHAVDAPVVDWMGWDFLGIARMSLRVGESGEIQNDVNDIMGRS